MAKRTRQRRGPQPDRQRPIRLAPVLGLSLLLLTVGWTLLWLFARAEAQANFEAWLASERSFGRVWTCPDQHVGGFPLAIELTCDHPTFKGPVADGIYEGGLARVVAAAPLYFPTNVTVTLTAPLEATEVATRRAVRAAWSSAVLTLRGLPPNDVDRGQLVASDLTLTQADRPADAVSIGHIAVGFKPVAQADQPRFDLDGVVDASGVRMAALDALFGSAEPLGAHAELRATQVRFDGGITAAEVLGPWTRAGGQVTVEALDVDKGPFRLQATGRFGLDDEHRLDGRFEAGFTGLGPVADRLGLPSSLVAVGGALASLLGGGAAPAPGTEMTLPVTAREGRVTVGPVRTGIVLTPLY